MFGVGTKSQRTMVAAGLAAICWTAASGAHAVDGVIELSEANASGGLILFTISTAGSYRLTSDLNATAGQTGIFIDTSNVTIDLNGFTIHGGGEVGLTDGISMANGSNIEIRNGAVRGFLRHGIFAANATNVRVIDVRALDNTADGINLEGQNPGQGGHLIRNCNASGNGGEGLRMVANGGLIEGNVSLDNGGAGIEAPANQIGIGGNVVRDNTIGISGGLTIACNLIDGVLSCPP